MQYALYQGHIAVTLQFSYCTSFIMKVHAHYNYEWQNIYHPIHGMILVQYKSNHAASISDTMNIVY